MNKELILRLSFFVLVFLVAGAIGIHFHLDLASFMVGAFTAILAIRALV